VGKQNLRVVWLDDEADHAWIQEVRRRVQRHGVDVQVTASGEEALRLIESTDPQVVVLDLRMEETAAHIAQEVHERRPTQSILIYSRFLGDSEFDGIEFRMSPLAVVESEAKDALRNIEDSSDGLLERIRTVSAQTRVPSELAQQALDEVERQHDVLVLEPDLDPFTMTFADFTRLEPSGVFAATRRAKEICRPLADLVFSCTTAAWFVVAESAERIVSWGRSASTIPDERELDNLGVASGFVPYCFSRPIEVDSFSLESVSVGNRDWTECHEGWYPSLSIDFGGSTSDAIDFHFDTGCPETLMSRELLEGISRVISFPRHILSSSETKSGRDYFFHRIELDDLTLRTAIGSPPVGLVVQAVFDWNLSPFTRICPVGNCPSSAAIDASPTKRMLCSKRHGLIGRSIFDQNRTLRIILDGPNKRTLAELQNGQSDRVDFGQWDAELEDGTER
jgi:DNA-binding NarL/FixJ family response regulator